jgi:hypothetical protein
MSLSNIPCALALASIFCIIGPQANAAEAASRTTQQPALNDFAGKIMPDGKIGRVGIGTQEPAATLDVYQGEVKIGSTGGPCTKALLGTLRYANTKLPFCDGAGWRNVSLDKAP